MNNIKIKVCLSIVCFFLLQIAIESKIKILFNGNIFTGIKGKFVEAIVFGDSKIIYTGTNKVAKRFGSQRGAEEYDLKGKTVIPGFHDGDMNFPFGARLLNSSMNFQGKSMDAILHRLRVRKKNLQKSEDIFGYNFEHLFYWNGKLPNKYDLDKISTDNHIVIYSSDGKTAWVNSKVLRKCHIGKHTPNVQGGKIFRFADDSPTGILCGNAIKLLKGFGFNKSLFLNSGLSEDEILNAIKYVNSYGITSITTHGNLQFLKILKKLESEKKLNIRFNIVLPFENIGSYLINKIIFKKLSPHIKLISISKNIDGNLYSLGSALFFKYRNKNDYGFLISDRNDIRSLVQLYKKNNIIGDFSAEGDRAVNFLLNEISLALRKSSKRGLRHRLSNFSFIIDEDINRLKELSVIPVIRPGSFIRKSIFIENHFGERKAADAMKIGTLLDRGLIIAFGSGWPGESLNPFFGIAFSVFRNINGDNSGWFVEEKISIAEAIRAYSYGSSYAVSDENWTGTIERGKYADIAILKGDLFSENLNQGFMALEVKVLETIINGKTVFKREKVN